MKHPGAYSLPASVSSGRAVFGSCERRTIALALGTYAAVPGPPTLGGGTFVQRAGGVNPNINTVEQGLMTPALLTTQGISGLGPIRAIAIAADSPIDSADLWLGDITSPRSRHRISPGRPWVGDITELDHVYVTVPEAVPGPWDDLDNADTVADWLAQNRVWDSQDLTSGSALAPAFARVDVTFPLRLELYRGELPPVIFEKRAPLVADMLVSGGDGTGGYGQLWTVIQGRRTYEVSVANTDGANRCRVVVRGFDAFLNRSPTSAVRRRCQPYTLDDFELDGTGASKRVYSTPYPLLAVKLSTAPATPASQFAGVVHIVARD